MSSVYTFDSDFYIKMPNHLEIKKNEKTTRTPSFESSMLRLLPEGWERNDGAQYMNINWASFFAYVKLRSTPPETAKMPHMKVTRSHAGTEYVMLYNWHRAHTDILLSSYLVVMAMAFAATPARQQCYHQHTHSNIYEYTYACIRYVFLMETFMEICQKQ